MSTAQQKYKIRPGTVDSGKEYEVKISALLSLRCVCLGVDEMWIASNADGVGDFDDIILHVKTAVNDGITFMLQLKHKDTRDNIKLKEFLEKGNFLLNKYSEDISNLQRSISSNSKTAIVKDLGEFDNIYFVFYTNRGEPKTSDILENRYDSDGPICFLKDVLNTSTTMNSLFGFNLEKLPEIASNNNFTNVLLLANQLSSQSIDKLISDKIKEIIDPEDLAQVDIKDIAQNFMQYIKDWSRGTLGGHYYLTKQDVLAKLSDLFLSYYAVNLTQNYFDFYECNKKNIWNQIMCHETITIVDSSSNHVALEFLVNYIGSEVRKHCAVSNNTFWCKHLIGQAQSLFYQRNPDLKEQMLKIVGNIGKITLLDVYKCLWLTNKLPLLLQVKRIRDYENILHVLKLTNYTSKVVVINNSTENLSINQSGIKTFCTLQDLHSNYKDAILKLPIKLQGRAGVALKSVIDENMYHYIKCNDVIDILLNNFNIGNNLEQLPAYFIERNFIKTFIQAQALREIKDDIFLLGNRSNRYFSLFPKNDYNAVKLEDIGYNNVGNYRVVLVQGNDTLEKFEKLKSTGNTIHHLFIHDVNYFEWKWTLGSTKNLRMFQIQLKGMYQKNIASYYFNIVNIVSADPGMGKTTLMNFIEHQAPTDKWLLKIYLNEHQRYYRKGSCKNTKSNAQKHLKYFNDMLLAENSCNVELSHKVFEKLLNAKNIIVLLDGFDEISVSYKNEVTELAKCLSTEGYHIWLTTRPHMKTHLERAFDAFTFTLKPFDIKDQEQYLTKYFYAENNVLVQQHPEIPLKSFVKQLLEASKINLRDTDAEFAGIPLQCKLLADAFNGDCRNYLNGKGVITFNKYFDLLDLYQNFIYKKFDILCEKFGENAADTHSLFRKYQFHFALKFLFEPGRLEQLDIENEFNSDYNKEERKKVVQFLQRDGVIMVDENLDVRCTHRTFAEYLAAVWLAGNLNSASWKVKETVDVLTEVRFDRNLEFLFGIFDRILTKNYPLHSAILNSRTEEVIQAIRADFNKLKEVDDGNRSVLHIVALYSKRFPFHRKSDFEFIENQEFNTDNMLDVINTVPDGVILDIGMDVLGYSPLDYALSYGSLTVANTLQSILKYTTLKPYKAIYFDNTYLACCAEFNYEKLFPIFLTYFVANDLLFNDTSGDVNITTYVAEQRRLMQHKNLQTYVKKRYKGKDITLSQLLHSADGYVCTGYLNSFYSDLRYAVVFGTEENIKKLLSEGQNVNKRYVLDYTVLHYATLHKKVRNTELLIDSGANVNAQISNSKETPLHFAIGNSKLGSNKLSKHFNSIDRHRIVAKMLAKNANTNSQDHCGNSPLHNASINGYTDIVKILIEKNANTNLKTWSGQTPLHYAIKGCYISTCNALHDNDDNSGAELPVTLQCANKTGQECALTKLLYQGTKINRQSVMESVTISCLYESCHYCTIVKLLSSGADINEQNDDKETPLHSTLKIEDKELFDINIVKLVLVYDADVKKLDLKGQTALHYASREGHSNILSELLNKGADVNKRDREGNTPLHFAKHDNSAYILISNGADVNAKNNNGKTPFTA